jgi:hypothetical protein
LPGAVDHLIVSLIGSADSCLRNQLTALFMSSTDYLLAEISRFFARCTRLIVC